MADLEDVHRLPVKRMRGIEKSRMPKTRKHLVWWELWETESEVHARIQQMIAEGSARADDEFVIVTWPREGES
jgi:hypothetical protein